MEPWQVYDASTPELLSELSKVRREDVRQVSRLARLSTLIEQELAERGHLDLFLDSLTVEVPPSKALWPAAVIEDKAAHADLAPPETSQTADPLSCFSSSHPRPSHGLLDDSFQHLSKSTYLAVASSASTDTAYKAPLASTAAPATAPCLSNHDQPDISSFADHSSQAAGPSVLEAAIAAYKQEKKKLWKARKAGAQAGWGFAKAHSSWPKPDTKASSTLGPLRMSAKNSSPAQPETSSASLEGAAAQLALCQQQDRQQADVLQQPWPQPDTSPAAPCIRHDQSTAKLQRLHPSAASQGDTMPEQACAAAAADLFSRAEDAKAQTVDNRECSSTDHSGAATPQSSNQAGTQQDAVDSLLPSLAEHSLNAVSSLPAQAPLSACPAAPLVAQLEQLADLQSHFIDGSQDADEDWKKPQCQCGSELQADEAVRLSAATQNAEDIQSTSSSHEQLTRPHTAWSGSVSAAISHTNSGSCSESDIDGESHAPAGVSVEQTHWLPPQFFRWQDPTGRHNDLGLSFEDPSKQDSEGGPESSSHIAEEEATTGPDQKGTAAAAAASPDQQVMSHRLSDWSMHSEDALCSWPSTPLHDPLSRESSTRRIPMVNSKQASKGVSKLQTVRKSWGSDDAITRDRFSLLPQGERLMLA